MPFQFSCPTILAEAIEKCIMFDEGGWKFTDDPNDPGGATFAGMTFKLFSASMQKNYNESPSLEAFKRYSQIPAGHIDFVMFRQRIIQVYYNEFIRAMKLTDPSFAGLPFEPIFSCAVNLGTDDAIRCLQVTFNKSVTKAIRIETDGYIGPKTLDAFKRLAQRCDNSSTIKDVTNWFCQAWRKTYIDMVQENCDAWEIYTKECRDQLEEIVVTGDIIGQYSRIRLEQRKPKYRRWKDLEGWLNRVQRYEV